MTSRRPPSEPPDIPGYTYLRLLGGGGFADVFLYRQELPRRLVAVKVLLNSLDGDLLERFQSEANLMAQLSHHPSIVTIFQADTVGDRPYIVMEYCSRPGLGQRYRRERISVPEALRIGVRLASAVEMAHRAGILHRDIKPANVLTTDFGWPALTDFGIAATTDWKDRATMGMSIPWSPPELLGDNPTGDERSDLYSLAATIYSVLAGRAPFEILGGGNSPSELVSRTERLPLPPTGRPDVPGSLRNLLVRATDKNPAKRYDSALTFARALQQVELELRLPVTAIELPENADDDLDAAEIVLAPGARGPEAARATRLRPVPSINPDGPAPAQRPAEPAGPLGGVRLSPAAVAYSAAVLGDRAAGTPAVHGTPAPELLAGSPGPEPATPERSRRERLPVEVSPEPAERRTGRILAAALAALVVLGILVVGAWLAFGGGREPGPGSFTPTPQTGTTSAVDTRPVPAPVGFAATLSKDGTQAVFTWTNPDPQDGDYYRWAVTNQGTPTHATVTDPTVTVAVLKGQSPPCIEVEIVRRTGAYSLQPGEYCLSK